jgi:hypothetical protein
MGEPDDAIDSELTPEVREAMSRSAFGRGLLRLREYELETFWGLHYRQFNAVGLLGAFAVYLVVVRMVRIPLIRQIAGITAGMLSMGIWWALSIVVVVFKLGARKTGESDTPSG